MRATAPVLTILALAGCPLPKDEDSSADSSGGDSVEETTTDRGDVDACDVSAWSLCFEFERYVSTEDWCAAISAEYGVSAAYLAEPCPPAAVLLCAIPAASGTDFDHDATAYYYAPDWAPDSAAEACESAGGTPRMP